MAMNDSIQNLYAYKATDAIAIAMPAASSLWALVPLRNGAGAIVQIGVNSSLARQLGHFLPASAIAGVYRWAAQSRGRC